MSGAENCSLHGEYVDDGTTDECPECYADRLVAEFKQNWPAEDRRVIAEAARKTRIEDGLS